MSQYNSMPAPGAYVPPNQSTPSPQGHGAQHQQGGYPQSQAGTAYQQPVQGYGQPSVSHKGSGGAFGQMMNQAVTTGKPMLNKLSKTISSKLGNKPATTGTPQHLQSYSNYQQHHGQQVQSPTPPQSYTFNPQTQQQPAPNTYTSQQSPYQQQNFGQGQGNYFAQQAPGTPQTSHSQSTPPPPPPPPAQQTAPVNGAQFGQGYSTGVGQQAHTQSGQQQQQHVPMTQGQYPGHGQGHHYQEPLHAQHTGQQMGVVGSAPSIPQSPQVPSASPYSPVPQQTQWNNSQAGSGQSFVPAYQQSPPPGPEAHTQSYFPSPAAQSSASSQQWKPLSPTGSESAQNHVPPTSISPPPPPSAQNHTPVMPSVSPVQSQSATPAPQTQFIAELPADLDSLTFANSKPVDNAPPPAPAPSSAQTTHYQAYQSPPAQAGPSSPGFTIPRRAVSISNAPFADPWRFADPLTELPTREFYVIADLIFDALDRKFEPQNTGLLEASKILKSWIDLTEDATQVFSYNSYSAFAKLWSLQGIPHVLVPCQPSLAPIWNFNQHSHAHELKLSAVPTHVTTHTAYIPALNRAGWYKFFFLEMMHGPDNINKLMPALCLETYKPGILHHPELTKRDKAEAPTLQARAAEIQATVINQVCTEIKAMMLADTKA
ncbi:hypothetical protein E8E13_005330 [Curvularia kusanoi]|uniref:DUF7514 domain-containing protein n=1 Tax=Curvularia kusanoi TaxID=90978 RepID=A0A9P4W3R8_CURKU|nr:hypothetical protein E8E13_005330 [Curvularia kusanoi]